ncbi:hypothetical protein G6F70_001877 [Rhizopus microsporus]|uniref:Uncharacterized protein n=2 Tax=Rhizopus TaxID=4842 RepID=A0A1X0S7Q2_RHIZD|nr:hypothetical protein G6F71_006222 [Rhizopus microsporus]KAG1202845.1 hypothetical protein G6F70_001877 [Rhizopus microsporus]KAG1208945.1 hypothetical protein G6F69_006790 [Rhizopus microsporus]KAG1237518.1 hypothetical protein G6F67_001126 [Rhizopus microsporus]KAG1262434.1 hypothetical protein G6F68_005935 [Rhizopus microsporus]
MESIFGQIDPASFALAIIGTLWGIEQGLGGITKNALKRFNTKTLGIIQSSYDRTDILRPLFRHKHDISDISVSLLCDMLVSTFNISSLPLRIGIKICILAQNSTFSLIKIILLLFANHFLFLHSLIYYNQSPDGAWVFDVEWSELTVKIAIEELRSQIFGDNFLSILYQISQSKSGPLACKLPSKGTPNDKVNIAELLITAFALYNVDGRQVVEKRDIQVLNLATVTFERANVFYSKYVAVNISIDEIILQFSINALAQCKDESDAAYLIQYAIATDNKWLLNASTDFLPEEIDGPFDQTLIDMAYAAGHAIAIYCRGTTDVTMEKSAYSNWINDNFIYNTRLPWCQHNSSLRKCHCWLTCFQIMDTEAAALLHSSLSERDIIIVCMNEDEAVQELESLAMTAADYVLLSSQSQNIINSTQFKRTDRIVIASSSGSKEKTKTEKETKHQIIPVE